MIGFSNVIVLAAAAIVLAMPLWAATDTKIQGKIKCKADKKATKVHCDRR
jgi:hypothetical protein